MIAETAQEPPAHAGEVGEEVEHLNELALGRRAWVYGVSVGRGF
jgi:hypothetical protein